MGSRTVCSTLASLALLAAPLAAQDTTSAPKDTVAVVRPAAPPAADTAAPRADTTAAAAVPDNAVRPGMTEAEVRARWGEPLATRTANDWTYLFYANQRERAVGWEDVVFLQHGQVMDAIVRSPDHVYAGVSSSPEGRVPVLTPPQGQPADSARGAAVTGVQVKPDQ
jgi:outer membrane protein assembly factor BamE (lipoprotein component of BamABCDE complex)